MMIWCQKMLDAIAAHGAGAYIADFPSYRPDLVEDMAVQIGCAFVDFRRERMAPLKFEAHRLPLSALDKCADESANERGIVLQNGEALLAAKSADERTLWINQFMHKPWARIVVLPLALYGREIATHERIIRFLPHEMPTETLIQQIATMRFQ